MNIKNKKVNFLAIIGIMVAFGSFAFSEPATGNFNANADPVWVFNGTSSSQYGDVSKYEPGEESDKCLGSLGLRCTISAPEGAPDQPDLSKISEVTNRP